jgi:TolB protein
MKIAFRSHRSGCSDIYVMNANGTGVTQLTESPLALDTSPTWSPDGSKIAFVSARDGNWEIYVMNADGTGETRLTNHPWSDYDPAWSPDGTRIAFRSDNGIFVANVNQAGPFVVNAIGSYVFEDDDPDDDSGQPTWSPNGSRIAFATSRNGLSEIYVVSADGKQGTRLTNTPTASEYDPVFSPDGTKIVYTRSNTSNGHSDYEVYTMNANGTGQQRLTVALGADAFPDWGRGAIYGVDLWPSLQP